MPQFSDVDGKPTKEKGRYWNESHWFDKTRNEAMRAFITEAIRPIMKPKFTSQANYSSMREIQNLSLKSSVKQS
jgi:hypothetical protein